MNKVFDDIYAHHSWGGQSPSGPGSGREQAERLGPFLCFLLRTLKIESMLDAACGDFNWLQHVALPVKSYTGIDIVTRAVELNNAAHANEQRSFLRLDITHEELPRCDFILCRDCLMHLPIEDAARALGNFKASGAKWLLSTTFPDTKENAKIEAGQWHPINLRLSPFDLPLQCVSEEDWFPSHMWRGRKILGLWELNDH